MPIGCLTRTKEQTIVARSTVVIFAAALLLGGCASTAHTPSSANTPSSATFTSRAFHFSASYDPSRVTAQVNNGFVGGETWSIPGVGSVTGPTLMLVVRIKAPASLPERARGSIQITAVKTASPLHPPTLAAFAREPYLRSLRVDSGWATDAPRMVSLNRLPAFCYSGRITDTITFQNYVVLDGDFVYEMSAMATSKQWPSVAATLKGVAQTFKVTR